LLLGVESLSWPIVTMVRIRLSGSEPSEEQMGLILTSVLFGLFSAIFWITFSYGIVKWMRKGQEASAPSGRQQDS